MTNILGIGGNCKNNLQIDPKQSAIARRNLWERQIVDEKRFWHDKHVAELAVDSV